MKTIQIKLITKAAYLMIFAITLMLTSCGEQGNAQGKKEETSDVQKIKKPSMTIHAAAFMGNVKAMEQHVKAGSDLNAKDEYGSSALTIAATFNKIKIAEILINAGADLNVTSQDGSTPLHTAAFFCRTEIVDMLLKKGADKTLKNNYGSTPYESVAGDFNSVKGIYEQINKDLGPLGLKLDFEYLEKNRPVVAKMLK